ncbi:MAG: antibiotic biosynthesis monooxygenase [Rhodospirillaceae bacterium]|jgi:heme-degrading monooxygenase HmoA|nr:antibiotic biosynthesis monooxygenase [Rhodospirillaceae bacterium]|tara:strand:- start:320 stop:661 length:342 start_codon:yes stop_codon:yes gene_type:complete
MMAVIFEFEVEPGQEQAYFDLAGALRRDLETIDGFISVERFESLSKPGKVVSLSLWRDEAAVTEWRRHHRHRKAQERGKADIFTRYRLMVAEVVREMRLDDLGGRTEIDHKAR